MIHSTCRKCYVGVHSKALFSPAFQKHISLLLLLYFFSFYFTAALPSMNPGCHSGANSLHRDIGVLEVRCQDYKMRCIYLEIWPHHSEKCTAQWNAKPHSPHAVYGKTTGEKQKNNSMFQIHFKTSCYKTTLKQQFKVVVAILP